MTFLVIRSSTASQKCFFAVDTVMHVRARDVSTF